jgi:hypothetical protein
MVARVLKPQKRGPKPKKRAIRLCVPGIPLSIRPGTPLSLEDAKRLVARWVEHYNHVRLHSALGYVTPADKLAGRETAIYAQRDRKLEAARQQRQAKRHAARAAQVAHAAWPNVAAVAEPALAN